MHASNHGKPSLHTVGPCVKLQWFLYFSSPHAAAAQVVVAEGAPYLEGLTMAQQLQSAGIATLVIPDVSIFALMARVNKVLIGAQAVLATGGILGPSGSKLVAQAAKHYRVPFIVVTGAAL